jgi:hypothetical protein
MKPALSGLWWFATFPISKPPQVPAYSSDVPRRK